MNEYIYSVHFAKKTVIYQFETQQFKNASLPKKKEISLNKCNIC